MFELDSVIVLGVFKLVVALAGILLGRATLLCFDKFFVNSDFYRWLENADDKAKAIYYSSRFISIAIIIGCAIG